MFGYTREFSLGESSRPQHREQQIQELWFIICDGRWHTTSTHLVYQKQLYSIYK